MEETISLYKKTIVNLVRFHYEKDDERFKEEANNIANYFIDNNNEQLGEYIQAQFGGNGTMVVM